MEDWNGLICDYKLVSPLRMPHLRHITGEICAHQLVIAMCFLYEDPP